METKWVALAQGEESDYGIIIGKPKQSLINPPIYYRLVHLEALGAIKELLDWVVARMEASIRLLVDLVLNLHSHLIFVLNAGLVNTNLLSVIVFVFLATIYQIMQHGMFKTPLNIFMMLSPVVFHAIKAYKVLRVNVWQKQRGFLKLFMQQIY